MKSLLIWQALVLLLAVGACQCSTNLENSTATTPIEYAPIVQLKAGKVVGVVQTVKNRTGKVHKYEGIRYGLAERFAKPTAVPPWTDVYNATHAREKCPQLSSNSTSKISEMFATTKLMGENVSAKLSDPENDVNSANHFYFAVSLLVCLEES